MKVICVVSLLVANSFFKEELCLILWFASLSDCVLATYSLLRTYFHHFVSIYFTYIYCLYCA